MTALEAVALCLPSADVPIDQVGEAVGLTPKQVALFRRFHGLDRVRLDPDGTLFDLLLGAASALTELRGQEHRIRYVLHARTMPVSVPYPINHLDEVCRALGLEHALAFSVTHHACASGLLAIDVAGRLLAANPDPSALALILAGEKAFTLDTQLIPNTAVCGEVSTACLVRAGGGSDRMLSYATMLRGEYDGRLSEDPDLLEQFQKVYPEAMAEVVRGALDQAGMQAEDLALILPHNVNQISWRKVCRLIGYPIEKVLLDNVPLTGHCFCADVFVNYHTATSRGLLRPGDRYLAGSAGIGAAFSAMIFEH
jgi:3-oxoacyl-[acyl-carrier-protein] synthase-3